MNETPPELDRITDRVLSYRPTLRVIAGAEDKPLVINDIEIPAYVLEDETRVLSQSGFLVALGRSRTPPREGIGGVDKLPYFLSANNLRPFISQEIAASTTPIKFQPPGGGSPAYGYRATLLKDVCDVYLAARRAGAILPAQAHIAEQAEILISAFAHVGIIALVDEATGYQDVRAQRALAQILEQYIAEQFRPWTRTFPYEFYTEIFRLKGWGSPEGIKRPAIIGRYTNDIVYARIAPGVLDELQRINPRQPSGNRRQRHHQWFTTDYGHPELIKHLERVIGIMNGSMSWAGFMRSLDRRFPKIDTTLAMPLEEDEG